MAIYGLSRSETWPYVLDSDPSKKTSKKLIDPDNPELGQEEYTDWDEDATVFTLKGLDVFLMGDIYDKSSQIAQTEGGYALNTSINKTNIEAVKFGLQGWTNFKMPQRDPKSGDVLRDKHGDVVLSDVPFKTEKVSMGGREYTVCTAETLSALGIQAIRELGQQIKERSEVSKVEAKK